MSCSDDSICKASYVVQYYLDHLCILNVEKGVLWTGLLLLGKGYLDTAHFTLVHIWRLVTIWGICNALD